MLLKAAGLTPDRVTCSLWEFDRQTSAEIDEELGWGSEGTSSWIRPASH